MNCYIYNPHSDAILPKELNRDNTLFYPEADMTTNEMLTTSRPKDFHIVTDCHFFPSLYKTHEVFIWEDGEWVNPNFQTYGCSYTNVLRRLWASKHSIPANVVNSKHVTNCMGHPL